MTQNPGPPESGRGSGLRAPCRDTPAVMSTALAAVPRERAGMASGAINTSRQLGYALGVAVLGVLFHSRLQDFARHSAGRPDLHASYSAGLDDVYLVAGCAGMVAGLLVFLLVRNPRPAITAAATESSALFPSAR